VVSSAQPSLSKPLQRVSFVPPYGAILPPYGASALPYGRIHQTNGRLSVKHFSSDEGWVSFNGDKHTARETMGLTPAGSTGFHALWNIVAKNNMERTLKELAESYFKCLPLERDIVQDKENGMTEEELGKKYKQRGYGPSGIKRLRRKLQLFLAADGWDEICLKLKAMEIIIPKHLNGYTYKTKPPQEFVVAVELLEISEQEQIRKQKDKEWNDRNKGK
jgi:hypothetical protein